MSGDRARVAVLGAGIAGLAAARELASAGVDPVVVDPGDRPGGVMQTDSVDGYRIEAGPNTFQAKAPFAAFASRHELWPALEAADPESRRRWLLHEGRLVELPHGLGSAIGTPLVSTRAKLRILAEPFVGRGEPRGESVHAFMARRLGEEVATKLVGAFLTGVYAGDERELGAEAVFPALVEWEREKGSLLRGGVAGAFAPKLPEAERARRGTWSARGGLGQLADTLAGSLASPVRLRTRAAGLARDGDHWRVSLVGPEGEYELQADAVVIATPAAPAAELLRPVLPDAAAALETIDYAPIVAVGLGVDPAQVRGAIEGFGFILPRSAGTKLLGCLFMSRLFQGRAPEGRELLHCMLGGVRWREVMDIPDDRIVEQLLADLDRCLGLAAEPQTLMLRRWPRAIPQPGVDHCRQVEAAQRAIAGVSGLALAGSYVAGVSVADSLASGVRAASLLGSPAS